MVLNIWGQIIDIWDFFHFNINILTRVHIYNRKIYRSISIFFLFIQIYIICKSLITSILMSQSCYSVINWDKTKEIGQSLWRDSPFNIFFNNHAVCLQSNKIIKASTIYKHNNYASMSCISRNTMLLSKECNLLIFLFLINKSISSPFCS